jgi:hypothetical protein
MRAYSVRARIVPRKSILEESSRKQKGLLVRLGNSLHWEEYSRRGQDEARGPILEELELHYVGRAFWKGAA